VRRGRLPPEQSSSLRPNGRPKIGLREARGRAGGGSSRQNRAQAWAPARSSTVAAPRTIGNEVEGRGRRSAPASRSAAVKKRAEEPECHGAAADLRSRLCRRALRGLHRSLIDRNRLRLSGASPGPTPVPPRRGLLRPVGARGLNRARSARCEGGVRRRRPGGLERQTSRDDAQLRRTWRLTWTPRFPPPQRAVIEYRPGFLPAGILGETPNLPPLFTRA
jgi:hypothetical protein